MLKPKQYEESLNRRLATAHTNFSTSVSAQQRAKVLNEARPLLDAHLKCREIWEALLLADYKKDGLLNDAALQFLLDKQAKHLGELLLVRNVDDLLDLLDEDEDGFLNEDEQILLFSTIKERMQICADELCNIHEYSLYKELMKAIRSLESDIINFQRTLRLRTHDKEISLYHDIGIQKKEKFKEQWNKIFEDFATDCQEKMQKLKEIHARQIEELNETLQKDVEFVKIKPKPVMKELQVREKVVAINERYAEAQQIRNELKSLEIEEQNRVENKILEEQEKKRKKLLKRQEKEINHVLIKNSTEYNKLKIKMQQDEIRLEKEIKLHIHDITKNQNLASRLAEKVGMTRDELRRTKEKSKKLKEFLADNKKVQPRRKNLAISTAPASFLPGTTKSKSIVNKVGAMSTVSASLGYRSTSPLKYTLKNVTKFNIKSDATGNDRPVNVLPDYMTSTSLTSKTGKLLKQSNKEKDSFPRLTNFYNDKLERVEENLI
ncbi:unnamed protein product [Blepharisma stoltei]|uniref:EF-hand domain-containing protein n=1 Tax=Blepharisma stoltei TaxID=1481888 RepID=A0AAU9J2V0_9CILI|nr:unnamed protein product [Blepharisma stoltei]